MRYIDHYKKLMRANPGGQYTIDDSPPPMAQSQFASWRDDSVWPGKRFFFGHYTLLRGGEGWGDWELNGLGIRGLVVAPGSATPAAAKKAAYRHIPKESKPTKRDMSPAYQRLCQLEDMLGTLAEYGMPRRPELEQEYERLRKRLPRANPAKPTAAALVAKAAKADPTMAMRMLRMVEAKDVEKGKVILTAKEAFEFIWPFLAGRDQEGFLILALDVRNRTLGLIILTLGNDSFTIVDPKQVFRWALEQGRSGAKAIIVAHNHPSNNATPSAADIDVTQRLQAAGRILGIQILDHLVVADTGRFVSLAERGELPAWERPKLGNW